MFKNDKQKKWGAVKQLDDEFDGGIWRHALT